jgi:hypothetical protein
LGATLEWFAESPPPPHNFDAVPDVRSPEPLHDIRAAVRSRTEHFERPQPFERVVPAKPEAEPAASERGQGETDGGEGTPVA